jgi:hypothetical protein
MIYHLKAYDCPMCQWKVPEGTRNCPNCKWHNPVLDSYDNREIVIVPKTAKWECEDCTSSNLETDEFGNMI